MALTSCGATIRSKGQTDREAQVLSDLKAANDPIVPPSEPVRAANIGLAEELQASSRIPNSDLPAPRVPAKAWKDNPEGAKEALSRAQEVAGIPPTFAATIATTGTLLLIAIAGVASKMNNPIGTLLGVVAHVATGKDPKDEKVLTLITSVIDEYKEADPNWKANPILVKLSDRMPNYLKDHIKKKSI